MKVYAVGAYFEAAAARRDGGGGGFPPSERVPAAFRIVLAMEVRINADVSRTDLSPRDNPLRRRRCLRAVLAMELSRDKYNAAISEAVHPRMARHGAAGAAALARFDALSAELPASLAKGLAIELHLAPGGALTLRAGGAAIGAMESRELCDALRDVYLGADPVSPPMKEAAVAGLRTMLM